MTKKISISGYYGFDNFGDEGILSILVQNLKSLGNKVEITVFSSNPEKTSSLYQVKAIKTFNIPKVFVNLLNTDVLVSGGGSLLQDVTSIKSLLYYLFVIFTALVFGKKVVIFAQGIGPINNPFARFLTKILLKNVSYLSVRDEKSVFLLRGWGLNPRLVDDPLWSLNLLEKNPKGRVGIQLRSWKTLTDDFINALAREVNEKYSDKEIYIYSFQDSQDLAVCKKFQNFISLLNKDVKTTLLSGLKNQEIIESFRSLDILIGMRFHACLLSLKYGIPTLPLSYDAKVEKLADEFEIPYVNLNEKDKIKTAIESLSNFDLEAVKQKTDSKSFDFEPIFDVILNN